MYNSGRENPTKRFKLLQIDSFAEMVELVPRIRLINISGHKIPKLCSDSCGDGGIGRHAGLRSLCRKAWGFNSPSPHHEFKAASRP